MGEVFPDLVSITEPTDLTPDGTRVVKYSGFIAPMVKAIQEMDLNIIGIEDMSRENTWRNSLIAWFADAANGIEHFVAGTLRAKTEICIDDICMNKDQLRQLLEERGGGSSTSYTPPSSSPEPSGSGDSSSNDSTGDFSDTPLEGESTPSPTPPTQEEAPSLEEDTAPDISLSTPSLEPQGE